MADCIQQKSKISEQASDACIFCKIVQGVIPCSKVFENETVLAFLDVQPHAKGHTVLIPKVHGETVFDLNEDVLRELIPATKKTMQILQDKLNPDGFNVGWNHNAVGGQVVPHLHIHIFPRYNGDGGGNMHSIIDNAQISVEEVAEMIEN
jgi:histidine triad (HIT) family protein